MQTSHQERPTAGRIASVQCRSCGSGTPPPRAPMGRLKGPPQGEAGALSLATSMMRLGRKPKKVEGPREWEAAPPLPEPEPPPLAGAPDWSTAPPSPPVHITPEVWAHTEDDPGGGDENVVVFDGLLEAVDPADVEDWGSAALEASITEASDTDEDSTDSSPDGPDAADATGACVVVGSAQAAAPEDVHRGTPPIVAGGGGGGVGNGLGTVDGIIGSVKAAYALLDETAGGGKVGEATEGHEKQEPPQPPTSAEGQQLQALQVCGKDEFPTVI